LFPFPHELTVVARLDRGAVTIATTLAPTGQTSVPVSFGYHPYLCFPDEARSRWHVTLGARQRLLLDEAMIPTGEREPVARQRFALAEHDLDDGFDALEKPASFVAAAANTAVKVEFLEGYRYAQVYAPTAENFICFEPMTAPANALVSGDGLTLVAPGRCYSAAFRVSLFSGFRTHRARN
jgi:galactose mutarotase-like enzyme